MTTIATRIERATTQSGSITFVGASEAAERVEWARIHDDARGVAAALQARGVGPGDHVALLGPTTRPLVTAIEATWLAGATVVVLPLPMRLGSIEEFVAQTRARATAADAALVVLDDDLAPFLEPRPGDPPMALLSELAPGPGRPRARDYERPRDDPEALAILQFTSGSTAEPKGVMLPHDRVLANLDAARAGVALDPANDVLLSWLPLYHDMGLIGLLTLPMITGTDLVLAGAQDFMASPARWMEWMSAFGGTATAGPNFAYALAARALARLDGLDLSRWRIGLNGAEPIDPSTVEAFCDAGARHGLDPRVVFCAFGMAEVTIAGTFPRPGTGMTVDSIDRRVLETDRYAAPRGAGEVGTRRLARLGKPVEGLQLRIVEPETGRAMREPRVLPATHRDGARVPRRLVAHRRPGVPGRGRARRLRAYQGRHHRRRPQRLPRGRRACCGLGRGRARGQRDRLRGRGASRARGRRGGGRDQGRRDRSGARRGVAKRSPGGRRVAARSRAREPRHPAEDLLGQAPAGVVPQPLPERGAPAHLSGRLHPGAVSRT